MSDLAAAEAPPVVEDELRDVLLYLSWLVARRRQAGRTSSFRLRLMSVQSVVEAVVLHTFVRPPADLAPLVRRLLDDVALTPGGRMLSDGGLSLRADAARATSTVHRHRMLVLEWTDGPLRG
jgi:hypothetical protein